MIIEVNTSQGKYNIVLERGCLEKAGEYLNLNRKVLVVTDDGVPKEYSDKLLSQCKQGFRITIRQGEASKNLSSMTEILDALCENEFTRADCVVACGGGVVGDMAGFAAACYMRGIDFYNVPTTVLSQVDSSIGGKTAVDFKGYKNIVGAFWQPKAVLIDSDTLKTLPERHINNGLAEALKMSLTSDAKLFDIFENGNPYEDIDTVIERSLRIKKKFVEEDEKETGLRKVLNFGHTLGHAVEAAAELKDYLHGECVAIGMLPMCSDNVREKLVPVLNKLSLPLKADVNYETAVNAAKHDKKSSGDNITIINVNDIGSFEMKKVSASYISEMLKKVVC